MKDFKAIWKQLAADKNITAQDFIQRAILTAVNSRSNVPKEEILHALIQKYFTPITNNTKLLNGMTKYQAILAALQQLKYHKMILNKKDLTEIFDTADEERLYDELLKKIDTKRLHRHYVYYFTIQDGLTPEQQGVQAGHALMALGHRLGTQKKNVNPNEIYFQWIGVPNTSDLIKIRQKHSKDLGSVIFQEPDHGNIVTALAFEPVLWNKRRNFMDYKLLTHS